MPSLKLSNPFRRGVARPSLKERAAGLKASAARVMRKPQKLPAAASNDVDADLIALEQQLAEARQREDAAWDHADACEERAHARRPERPACLIFKGEDHKFGLRQLHEHPAAMAGSEVTGDDVEWMSRKPLTHQVLRPVRDGERVWRDSPGRIPEIVPWPEAQARADEIIAAWKAWGEAIDRVRAEEGADEAEADADAATGAITAVLSRIAETPAAGIEGMRIKLRSVQHFCPTIGAKASVRDLLLHSLMKDAGVSRPTSKAEEA